MLKTLTLKNFAIVEALQLEPAGGFSALTGETGAGKSIVVAGINLVLGARAGTEYIREGASSATIEALWELPENHPTSDILRQSGIEAEGELLIKRTIGADGKSRYWANGSTQTAAFVKSLAPLLVNISGQHEHISLLDPENHIGILDAFGGYKETLEMCGAAYREFKSAEERLKRLKADEGERHKRIDFINFQLAEIAKIAPKEGEQEALSEERERLKNIARIAEAAQTAINALSDDETGAAQELIGRASAALEKASGYDPKLNSIYELVEQTQSVLNDAVMELNRYIGGLSDDPARLDEIEARLFELSRLYKRFGGDYASAAQKKRELEEELGLIDFDEAALEELEKSLEISKAKYEELATRLRKERAKAEKKLSQAVSRELGSLGFVENAFSILMEDVEPSEKGIDKIEFMFAPNPGEPARPLSKIASGGELSRFLLGVKMVLAESDPVITYLFDEVDSGVGGAIAERIGLRLKKLSAHKQIICITHLAPIAAIADNHFKITKEVSGGRTYAKIEAMDKAGREREIARMLAGDPESRAAIKHAREILKRN